MAISATYKADGATRTYDIDFNFDDQSTIRVTVDEVPVPFSWSAASQVELETAPAAGSVVRIYRRTGVDNPEVVYQDTQVLVAGDLNTSTDQVLDSQQELWAEFEDLAQSALRTPRGETLALLPAASERAGKALIFNADGSPSVASIGGTDGGLRGDLSKASDALGGALVAFIASGTGAVSRSVLAKLRDVISVKDFGAVGDGVVAADGTISGTDDTAALQAAIDAAVASGKKLYVPAGKYRTTAPLIAASRVNLRGEEPTAETSSSAGTKRPIGGTWFLLDHLGIGFYCRDDADPSQGKYFSHFDNIGTYRKQPAPGAGWAPTAYAEDFRVEHRVVLGRVFTFNPYVAVKVRGAGVLTVESIRGQPLFTGIEIERSTDINDIGTVHFWPYWTQEATVTSYTINNLVAIRPARADGLQVRSLFSWGCKYAVEAVDAAGAGSGLAAFYFARIYADKCGGGVRIVSNNYAAYGTVGSIIVNGDSAVQGSGAGVEIAGSVASTVDITSLTVTRAHEEALKVSGAAHVVHVSPNKIESWNRLGTSKSAFFADNGATITITTPPKFAGGTALYNQGTSGIINLPVAYPSGKPLASPHGFQSKRVSIPDDGVVSFDAPATEKTAALHLVPASVPADGNPLGIYWLRASASPSAVAGYTSHAGNVALFTIPLTGTTGVDGNLSIAAANDGKFYIENRTGVARTFFVTMLGN